MRGTLNGIVGLGRSLAAARARLQGQPLTPEVVYKPARTGERIALVVDQFPDKGTASAGDSGHCS